MYPDITCVFCQSPSSVDSFKHYIESCTHIMSSGKFSLKTKNLRYDDLFGNFDAQVSLVRLWLDIDEYKKKLTQNT